jgi:hypothetical protein
MGGATGVIGLMAGMGGATDVMDLMAGMGSTAGTTTGIVGMMGGTVDTKAGAADTTGMTVDPAISIKLSPCNMARSAICAWLLTLMLPKEDPVPRVESSHTGL